MATGSHAITKVKQGQACSAPGWMTAWKYQGCQLGCAGGVMDNGWELLIRYLSSNSNWVRYIQLVTNTLAKGMNPPLLPPGYGSISKTCITK